MQLSYHIPVQLHAEPFLKMLPNKIALQADRRPINDPEISNFACQVPVKNVNILTFSSFKYMAQPSCTFIRIFCKNDKTNRFEQLGNRKFFL